jgi:hypothetical protein
MDQLPKPLRKLAPQPPKHEEKNSQDHESALHFRPHEKLSKPSHENGERET